MFGTTEPSYPDRRPRRASAGLEKEREEYDALPILICQGRSSATMICNDSGDVNKAARVSIISS